MAEVFLVAFGEKIAVFCMQLHFFHFVVNNDKNNNSYRNLTFSVNNNTVVDSCVSLANV